MSMAEVPALFVLLAYLGGAYIASILGEYVAKKVRVLLSAHEHLEQMREEKSHFEIMTELEQDIEKVEREIKELEERDD